ncbi:MAG: DUF4003 family protein [Solobacterium sp.]|nr:DUF4003 family protein [Solobacterium sp.]MBR0478088.1 DUF4003 family protein [Solobacterium sp.]
MIRKVRTECNLYVRNYAAMAKENVWGNDMVRMAAAGISVVGHRPLDIKRIQYCEQLLKAHESIFSSLRGLGSYVYCVKMAMSDDPEAWLDHLSEVHAALRRGWFTNGTTALAAMNIVDIVPPEQYGIIVERTLQIYEAMGNAHVFLTSEEDMAFAALMAIMGESPTVIHRKAEEMYSILLDTLDAGRNTIQTISHILSLYDGDPESMCRMVVALHEGLKQAGHPMGGESSAAVLATFAASRRDIRELVEDIAAADDFLYGHKPFKGIFGQSARLRRMIAVLCVQSAEESADSGLSASIAAAVSVSLAIQMAAAAAAAA